MNMVLCDGFMYDAVPLEAYILVGLITYALVRIFNK